jgi:hypothetical protein
MKIIKELWILAKVGFIKQEVKNVSQTLIFIIKIFVFAFLLKSLALGIQWFLEYAEVFQMPRMVGIDMMNDYSLLQKFLFVCVHAPIAEELACRIGLKFSKLNLSLMVFAIVFVTVRIPFFWLLTTSLSFGVLTYLLLNKISIYNFTKKFWVENRKIIFYTFLIAFAFNHLMNYSITLELLIFSPIVLLPHFIGGFFLAM